MRCIFVWMSAAWAGRRRVGLGLVTMKIAHCSVAFKDVFRIPNAKCLWINFRKEVMDRSPINLLELVRSEESFRRKDISCRRASVLNVDGGSEILRYSLFGAADGNNGSKGNWDAMKLRDSMASSSAL